MTKDLVDAHVARLVGRTRENRLYALRMWGAWLEARGGAGPVGGSRQDIEEWTAQRRMAGVCARTVRTDLSHLRGWYRWLLETGRRGDDPTALVRAPAVGPSDRPWLGRADAERLLDASLGWEGGELGAQVHLWLLSGLRPGEPRALRVGDLRAHDGAPTLRVRATKTPGAETLTLPASTARLLDTARAGRREGALLRNPRTGRPWTKSAERGRFQRLVAHAGVPPVTPYGLRVTMITLALDAGFSERQVSAAARHASSAQTARYDRLRVHASQPVAPGLEDWIHDAAARGGDCACAGTSAS